jgi:hypothetical protein
VNEAIPNDDTDYVTTGTPGQKDTYEFEDLAAAGAIVYGVQMLGYGRKTDIGIRTIQMLPRVAGTDYGSGELILYPDYNYHHTTFELNPDTSLKWTEAEINSGEFGFELLS